MLADTTPLDMAGVWTSQRTVDGRVRRDARHAHDPPHRARARASTRTRAAAGLERGFLANGLEAKSTRADLHEAVGASYTLNWLLLGFMGLGLVVGVAALGVISARSVVERRQQIGVLRAIGFRRGMVQLSFLLESSFIALTAIVVGTALGLIIAYNVIQDAADQPSWQGALHFVVPWTHLAIVFCGVYAAALLTTLAPAARASRVQPARGPPLRVIGMNPDWEERLFDGRPTPLRLYRAIRQRLETFGPLTVRGTDTQVSFRARRAFAWVWLPQRWAEGRPADSVTLTFSLDAPLDDRRIVQVVEPRPGHWTHHVVIQDESDLDGAVDGWLRQAYGLAGGDAR